MTTLLYRGHKYTQHRDPLPEQNIELRYRQSYYKKKLHAVSEEKAKLTYRGNKYISKENKVLIKETDYQISRNEVFSLARQIINAQFYLGDNELSSRLWDEIATRRIDPKRIINLMYRCCSHENEQRMLEVDLSYLNNN